MNTSHSSSVSSCVDDIRVKDSASSSSAMSRRNDIDRMSSDETIPTVSEPTVFVSLEDHTMSATLAKVPTESDKGHEVSSELPVLGSNINHTRMGHHFYYTPPSAEGNDINYWTDFTTRRDENSFDNCCNDQSQPQRRVQNELNFDVVLHDQRLLSPQYLSSPMVTPPTRKSSAIGESSGEHGATTGTNVTRSTNHENQSNTTSTNHGFQSMMTQQLHQYRRPSSLNHPGAGVPHIYHDYMSQTGWNNEDDDSNNHDTTTATTTPYIRKKTGGVSQPFPEKLHEMLTTVDNTTEQDIVTWLPHGRAFIVRKPKEFTELIMPTYFKQTKLTSFQRQLNLYGFRRLTQGADAGAYYHELFLRIRPILCQRMVRQKVKGTGHKQPADATTEPNFYEMSSLSSSIAAPITTSSLSHGMIPPTLPTINHFQSIPDSQERHGFTFYTEPALPFHLEELQQVHDRCNETDMNTVSSVVEKSDPSEELSERIPADAILDSPGLQCAAHLLQGIASGYISNTLQIPTNDALTTHTRIETEVVSFDGSNEENRRSTSFLQPRLSNEFR